MNMKDGTEITRAEATKAAATDLINAFKDNENIGIALVTYGSDVFDGRNIKFGTNTPYISRRTRDNNIYNIYGGIINSLYNWSYIDGIESVRYQEDIIVEQTGENCSSGFKNTNKGKDEIAALIPENVPFL